VRFYLGLYSAVSIRLPVDVVDVVDVCVPAVPMLNVRLWAPLPPVPALMAFQVASFEVLFRTV
jgi:hypothetical protein